MSVVLQSSQYLAKLDETFMFDSRLPTLQGSHPMLSRILRHGCGAKTNAPVDKGWTCCLVGNKWNVQNAFLDLYKAASTLHAFKPHCFRDDAAQAVLTAQLDTLKTTFFPGHHFLQDFKRSSSTVGFILAFASKLDQRWRRRGVTAA